MSPPPRFPVSVKGVVLAEGPPSSGLRVALLRNERDEWELPGGKLEAGESPEACLAREIEEELGVLVRPGRLLDVWLYRVPTEGEVLVVTYGCQALPFGEVRWSAEHREGGLFTLAEIDALRMPEGYRRSIRAWASRVTAGARSVDGPLSSEA